MDNNFKYLLLYWYDSEIEIFENTKKNFYFHCALLLQVEAKFMGKKNIENFQDDGEPFRCCVKFEGPSVLDGVRNLASCGLANEPLPKHLLRVNSLGTNNFVLKSKEKS